MSNTDLVFNSAFTLPGEGATLPQLEYALALVARFTFKGMVDGRALFSRLDARHKQDLIYLVPRADDPRADSGAMAEILRANGAWSCWMPLHNGKHTSLIDHPANVLSQYQGESGALLGTWKIVFPQSFNEMNRPQNNPKFPIVQVGEEYSGFNLLETVCRGCLGYAGRYKDVYLYRDDKHNTWRSISLNGAQLYKLTKGHWEQFHRRFIWFPSLNKYAHLLEWGNFPPDMWKAKTALAEKELTDRQAWKNSADLRDYLDNFRYKGKGVFDNNRLPHGELL